MLSVVVTLALVAGGFAYGAWRRESRLESGEGALKQAFLVQTASGPVLMALESLEFSGEDYDETVYRATAYDARTGVRLARRKEVTWRGCVPAGEGLAWCHGENDSLEVVNVPTLDTKFDQAALTARLGHKVMNASQLDVSAAGRLRVTLDDGTKVELDATTLNTSELSKDEPRSRPGTRLFDCSIPNSEREGLCVRGQYGAEQRVDPGAGWLRMQVLAEVEGGVLIIANSSLDDSANSRRVVRLDSQFKEVGQTTIGKIHGYATYEPMWAKPGELFLISSNDLNETIGIDARDAREVFRIKH